MVRKPTYFRDVSNSNLAQNIRRSDRFTVPLLPLSSWSKPLFCSAHNLMQILWKVVKL